MKEPGRVHVIGVSGPDGAGKSTALGLLRRSLADEGVASVSLYVYGCVLCRRIPARRRHGGQATRSPFSRFVREAHALIDVFELSMRLSLAKARARRVTDDGTAASVVLSDRSPLDGLAKHDPRAGSVAERAYARMATSYEVIAWLDAPPDVLAARDKEHAPRELERQRDAFARWATLLPNAARIDATASRDAVVSTLRELALPSKSASSAPPPPQR